MNQIHTMYAHQFLWYTFRLVRRAVSTRYMEVRIFRNQTISLEFCFQSYCLFGCNLAQNMLQKRYNLSPFLQHASRSEMYFVSH